MKSTKNHSVFCFLPVSSFRVVLRNYIAQNAIDAAEKGDFTEVQHVLKILERPFDEALPGETIASTGETNAAVRDEAGGKEISPYKFFLYVLFSFFCLFSYKQTNNHEPS